MWPWMLLVTALLAFGVPALLSLALGGYGVSVQAFGVLSARRVGVVRPRYTVTVEAVKLRLARIKDARGKTRWVVALDVVGAHVTLKSVERAGQGEARSLSWVVSRVALRASGTIQYKDVRIEAQVTAGADSLEQGWVVAEHVRLGNGTELAHELAHVAVSASKHEIAIEAGTATVHLDALLALREHLDDLSDHRGGDSRGSERAIRARLSQLDVHAGSVVASARGLEVHAERGSGRHGQWCGRGVATRSASVICGEATLTMDDSFAVMQESSLHCTVSPDMVVAECALGATEASVTRDALERLLKRRSSSSGKAPERKPRPLPRLVGALTLQSLEADVMGAHVSVPTVALALESEYRERSVQRTDAERRAARRLARKTDTRVAARAPLTNLAPDLDRFPTSYHTRASFFSDAIKLTIDGAEVAIVGPCEAQGAVRFHAYEDRAVDFATHAGDVDVLVELVSVDLTRPATFSLLRKLPSADRSDERSSDGAMVADVCMCLCVGATQLRIAGVDPRADARASRGIEIKTSAINVEGVRLTERRPHHAHFPSRDALELREDLRVEAHAVMAAEPGAPQTLAKLSLGTLEVRPVTAKSAPQREPTHTQRPSGGDWELRGRANIASDIKYQHRRRRRQQQQETCDPFAEKPILASPRIDVRARFRDGDTVATVRTDSLYTSIDVFHIYLVCMAIATLRGVRGSTNSSPGRHSNVSLSVEVRDIGAFVKLPHDVRLYAHLKRLKIDATETRATIDWDMLICSAVCPTIPGKWDDILRIKAATVMVEKRPNEGFHPFVVSLNADTARLRIPFRFVFSDVIDNGATMVKLVKQLVHRLVHGHEDSCITPEPEPAKRLPEVRLRVKVLAVEFQDDPFETRLNIVWRAGSEEQRTRIDRREAFERKVEAIRAARAASDATVSSEEELERLKEEARHTVSVEQARDSLAAFDSINWIKRVRNAVAEQGRREDSLSKRLYGNAPEPDLPVDLLPTSRVSPLVRLTLQGVDVAITRPSFELDKVGDYLHEVGHGLPTDTEYTLLVPFHLSWTMDEARIQLRDHPVPLLNVPPSDQGRTWHCETDFVVGEEVGSDEAVRQIACRVIPAHDWSNAGAPYTVTVPRTAMPVKTYSTPRVRVSSPYATRLGWGNSMQPAIQDVMRVLDTLTRPTSDPSERIGFWDKIRLQFHWRTTIEFDSHVHIHLKGSRDPYLLTGFGAGFSKAWRGNVQFLIGHENADNEFFQIVSDEYVLGIPNLRDYADAAASGSGGPSEEQQGDLLHNRLAEEALFTKVCARFVNGVRWGMGASFERTCGPEHCDAPPSLRKCRLFDFKPHWEVHTRTPESMHPEHERIDSFAGFRSDFIHFSISITSPRPGASDDVQPYNCLHFSPLAFSHFWAWWRTFDSSMSLPIRRGKLFPSTHPPSKKFGRHTATIKYRFELAPLWIAHTYHQDTPAEWARGLTTVLGVKGKVRRFRVDLHQRSQEEVIRKLDDSKTVTRKAFYRAEIDCDTVDLRAVSATFREREKELIVSYEERAGAHADDMFDGMAGDDGAQSSADVGEWFDLNDYTDALYAISDESPRLRVVPLMFSPRFTYRRRSTEGDKRTKFGDEPSHTCLMGSAAETFAVQIQIARERLAELKRDPPADAQERKARIDAVTHLIERLQQFANGGFAGHEDSGDDMHLPHLNALLYQDFGDWINRYIIHNPVVYLSNETRDILLKYYYSSRERKGFVYHCSARVLRFLRDLERDRRRHERKRMHRRRTMNKEQMSHEASQLLQELVDTASTKFWASSEEESGDASFGFGRGSGDEFGARLETPEGASELPDHFAVTPGHLIMCIKPQIVLKSDVDSKSTVVITAITATARVFSITDQRVADDPVNALALHSTFAKLDRFQVFYPNTGGVRVVPLETLVDLRAETWHFDRLVSRATVDFRYDKYNPLRMSVSDSNARVTRHMTDHFAVHCQHFAVSANPDHFAAIYNVATDLLLYNDPIQQHRSKQLESVVFTHDFSNLDEISRTIKSLQERVRILEALVQLYQTHNDELDDQGRLDLFSHRAELAHTSVELNLVVQAMIRAQKASGIATASKTSSGLQIDARAHELVWHARDKSEQPFAKLSMTGVEFSCLNRSEGSVTNRIVIKDLKALNSSPECVFPEIISKLRHAQDKKDEHELSKLDIFAAVKWNVLPAVGGIPIIEQFEFHLHPVRLQLERAIGHKIMDYTFSQRERNLAASRRESVDVEDDDDTSLVMRSNNASTDSLSQHSTERISSGSSTGSIEPRSSSHVRRIASTDVIVPHAQPEISLDAEEMRTRAALFRTFILVDFTSTTLCLSYRSEREHRSRLPDVYNVTYKTPSMQYRGRTWSYLDLLNEVKRDVVKSVWSQKTALLGQLLNTAHRKLPLQNARSAAKKSLLGRKMFGRAPVVKVRQPTGDRGDTLIASSNGNGDHVEDVDEDDDGAEEDDVANGQILESAQMTDEPEAMSMSVESGTSGTSVDDHDDERSASFPIHRQLRESLSGETDESKARLLLGRSYDHSLNSNEL